MSTSNLDLSEQLEYAEEENILLEQDLKTLRREKNERIQRVKDELRDVQHELSTMLLETNPDSNTIPSHLPK